MPLAGSSSFSNYAAPPTDHNNELRLLILSRFAGAVIGKGGETIKRLRQEHSINLNIPDSTAPERVVTISGEFDNVLACLRDILPKMTDTKEQMKSENEAEVVAA